MQLGNGFTLNPLCEHKPFSTEVPGVRVDGAEQDWVSVNNNQYKFIKVSYGVTKFEAEEICRENGGDCSNYQPSGRAASSVLLGRSAG